MPDATESEPGLTDEVTQLLVAMGMRLNRHFAAVAAEFGLVPAEGKVLMALAPDQPQPMRVLADLLGFDASNLTGVVDRLEARDVVSRLPDASDRRVKAIGLTATGIELRRRLSGRLRTEPGPVGGLSEAELTRLRDVLRHALADES